MKSDKNPLNIRYSRNNKWLGQIGSRKGFVLFDTLTHGVRAAIVLLKNYYEKYNLNTIEKIISRYAPSSENDTQAYISYVSTMTNIPRDRKISLEQLIYDVLPAMSIYESHTTLPHVYISFIVSTHNIDIYENEKG